MHDPESQPGGGRNAAPDPALSVPSSASSGELTLLERLDAFRDLIRHGNALLGEVVTYCREAEAAVNALEADREAIDGMKAELDAAKRQAAEQTEAAHAARTQLEAQRREAVALRAELSRSQLEAQEQQRTRREGSEVVERQLSEARRRATELERELETARTQAAARVGDDHETNLDGLEARLHATEHELAETRRALEEARSRRDRAIALIKPKQVGEAGPRERAGV